MNRMTPITDPATVEPLVVLPTRPLPVETQFSPSLELHTVERLNLINTTHPDRRIVLPTLLLAYKVQSTGAVKRVHHPSVCCELDAIQYWRIALWWWPSGEIRSRLLVVLSSSSESPPVEVGYARGGYMTQCFEKAACDYSLLEIAFLLDVIQTHPKWVVIVRGQKSSSHVCVF